MRFTGKLHTWNEDRGFGFIRPLDGGQDVFVHLSALPRGRPGPEEVLTFELAAGPDGKKKATYVRRQAVEMAALAADRARSAPRSPRHSAGDSRYRGTRNVTGSLLTFAILVGIGWFAYDDYRGRTERRAMQDMPPVESQLPLGRRASAASPFRCDGRTMCSQMKSCDEAKFFINNCPGTKMDGNNDGVPCEQQWCTR